MKAPDDPGAEGEADTVDSLSYEITLLDGFVSEVRSGTSDWAFVYVKVRDADGDGSDGCVLGGFTDFLYKNVKDMAEVCRALSDRDETEIHNHDSGGNYIRVFDHDGGYVLVDLGVRGSGGGRVWVRSDELRRVVSESMGVIESVVSDLNPDVAAEIGVGERLDEVRDGA